MDANRIGMIFRSLCLLVVGLLSLVQPEKMLRRTIRDKPELADDKRAVIILRFIGAGLFVMGLKALVTLAIF
jgi:hypothetical protein